MWILGRHLCSACRTSKGSYIFQTKFNVLTYATNNKKDTPSSPQTLDRDHNAGLSISNANAVKESVQKLKDSAISKFHFNIKEKLDSFIAYLEDVSGQKQSDMAQKRVTEVQEKFFTIQENRRSIQKELSNVQRRLKAASALLEKTNRGDPKYLDLVKDEHQIIVEEDQLIGKLRESDELERAQLSYLGEAIRISHEAYQDKDVRMKSISLLVTCGSLILGIFSVCYYYYRGIELQSTVKSFIESRENMQIMITQLAESIVAQNEKTEEFLQDLKSALGNETSDLNKKSAVQGSSQSDTKISSKLPELKLFEQVMFQQDNILNNINEVKTLIGLEKSKENENNIIYVGPNLENVLKTTESNIEWKMKMNSLATVAFVYGALALTIPVIVAIISGK